MKGIEGERDDKKRKPSKRRSEKITRRRRRTRKMGAKEGDIKSETSREAGTAFPLPTPCPLAFAGPAGALTLILPWLHPTVAALTSACLPAPSLKDTQGKRRKEGGRERERRRKEGDFCSQENKTVKVGGKHRKKRGRRLRFIDL